MEAGACERSQFFQMAKQLLTQEKIENMIQQLDQASCAMDNVFVGTSDARTGVYDCQECFTKQDIKTLKKAADLISKLRESFDGTRKQR